MSDGLLGIWKVTLANGLERTGTLKIILGRGLDEPFVNLLQADQSLSCISQGSKRAQQLRVIIFCDNLHIKGQQLCDLIIEFSWFPR